MEKEIQIWRSLRFNGFTHEGNPITIPENWCFVKSGDPGLTRRLKTGGPYYVLVHRRKNRIESLGIYCDRNRAAKVQKELEAERADPAYQKKLDRARELREEKQNAYVVEFRQAVVDFLHFAPRYEELAWDLADAVTDHAVPVGSGTVARTERIPLAQRAEAAVIAWMRHQTTAYDHMVIARVAGERREVRRRLAERSRALLEKYRSGEDCDLSRCPLARALK